MRNHKIDERKDKIRKIKEGIENTQDAMEFADELIDASTNDKYKQSLKAHNESRDDYIKTMLNVIKEEIGKKE